MGKAADNEAIKLRASYSNNLAVGVTAAGIIAPYLLLVQKIMTEGKQLASRKGLGSRLLSSWLSQSHGSSSGARRTSSPRYKTKRQRVRGLIVRSQAGLLSVARRWRQRCGDDRRRALPAGRHRLAFVHQIETAVFHSGWQRLACGIVQTWYLARWPWSRRVPTQTRLLVST